MSPPVPGFPGFSYYRAKGRPNWFRLAWREDLGQRTRILCGWPAVMETARKFAPRLTAQRVHVSEIDDPPPALEDELDNHRERMGRKTHTPGSTHSIRSVRALRHFFAEQGWNTVKDITAAALDKYKNHSTDSSSKKSKLIKSTLYFLRLLPKKAAHHLEDDILRYAIEKHGSQHIYQPWSEEEDRQYFAYLSRGMEILAAADPDLCWHDRIHLYCHTSEFRTRMKLLCFYLILSRHMTRPTELTRLTSRDWDPRRKAITLGWDKAKAAPKLSLCDDELAWLMDVSVLNRQPTDPLLPSFKGGFWNPLYLSKVANQYIALAGLVDRTHYEIKFTTATRMYENPEEFTAVEHERRLARVRAISGHTRESESVERYIKSRWGTELGLGARVYYNKRRAFPFRIEDYPPRKSNPEKADPLDSSPTHTSDHLE